MAAKANLQKCDSCNKRAELNYDEDTDMALCDKCFAGQETKTETHAKAESHAKCYAKGLHEKSPAGRAACRKARRKARQG